MTPHDRVKRLAKLAAATAIVVAGLLCFAIGISPRLGRLNRVEKDLAQANAQLREMHREIEDVSIIGAPAPGESRYEKFGILGADEEELFLSDLIAFCKETGNTLNVVRRADSPQRAQRSPEQDSPPAGRSRTTSTQGEQPAVPQPVIQRVPHTVNYAGSFLSSFELLRKLESYKRLLTVERVEIATDTRTGYPRVNGNITIDLYLVRGAADPPPAAEAAEPISESIPEDHGEQEQEPQDQGE